MQLETLMKTALFGLGLGLGAMVHSQDLWRDSGEIFTESKANPLPQGTIIHIQQVEAVEWSIVALLGRSEQNNLQNSGVALPDLSFLREFFVDHAQGKQRTSQFSLSSDFGGKVAATITAYDPTAERYSIEARRRIALDGKPIAFVLLADLSRRDLRERQVKLEHLASVQIFVRRGDGDQALLREGDFLGPRTGPPPGPTEDNELDEDGEDLPMLNEAAKRRLFLEWLNLLLNGLF